MEGEAAMFRNKEQNMEEEQGGKYKGNDMKGESKKNPQLFVHLLVFLSS